MSIPGARLPPAQVDIRRLIARVERLERRTLDGIVPPVIGAIGATPLTTGRSFYEGGSGTTVATGPPGTFLSWPDSLHVGDVLMDFTDPTQPTVLKDGIYIVDATAASSGGIDFAAGLDVLEADFSYSAAGTTGFGLGAFHIDGVAYAGSTISAPLHAGAKIVFNAQQESGSDLSITFVEVAITFIAVI